MSKSLLNFMTTFAIATLMLACSESTGPDKTPASIEVSGGQITLRAGGSTQISFAVKSAAGDTIQNPKATFTSANTSIVTVSAAGVVTSIGPAGRTDIAISAGAAIANVPVIVSPANATSLIKAVDLPASPSVGSSYVVSAKALDAFGNGVPRVTVSFAVEAGGGTVTPTSTTTDSTGIASASIRVGTTITLQRVSATSSGLTGSVSYTATTVARSLDVSTYSTGDATKPVLMFDNGGGVKVSRWTTSGLQGAATTQSAYTDSVRKVDVTALYDPSGLPTTLVDRKTGETIRVAARDDRVDFLFYDQSGKYSSAVALITKGGSLYMARILTKPLFSGQITANSDRFSFSATSRVESGLGPLVEAPKNFVAYFNANAGQAAVMLGFEGLASSQMTIANLRRSLTQGGLLLIAAGIYATQVPGTGLVGVGLAAAGMGAIIIARVPGLTGDIVERFDSGFERSLEDGAAIDYTPDVSIREAFNSITSAGTMIKTNVSNLVKKTGDAVRDRLASFLPSQSVPSANGDIPSGSTTIDGYGVDQTNTLYPLTGTVTGSGGVTATGSSGGRSVTVSGTLTGTTFNGNYGGSPGSGTITGSTSALEACQTQQASGGQGTYSRAFNMGATTGNVSFSYDAFSIPDAFQVATAGVTVFSTGGLVSGTGSKTFALSGSSIVAVTVSAPQSGTAWNFTLSCPQ